MHLMVNNAENKRFHRLIIDDMKKKLKLSMIEHIFFQLLFQLRVAEA